MAEDLLNHFYFNQEYWCQQVRTLTHEPDMHGNNIKMIHTFVAQNEVTNKFYTPEVQQYFEAFEKTCRQGKFADLPDVSLYRHQGIDSDGLDLWCCLKGSV